MKHPRYLLRGRYRDLIGNVATRLAALVALALATLAVARSGGPAAVGVYVLLRVLPSLVGVVISSGLPGAITYFLAGEYREDRRLPLTVLSMAVAGGITGTLLWAAASPLLVDALFPGLALELVAVSAVLVLTRVLVATAKSWSQGSEDLRGANRVIFTEEFMFLPMYGIVVAASIGELPAVLCALVLADLATLSLAWGRLAKRGFFRDAARPSRRLARSIASYGVRAQTGGVISLMNLRLDFIILNVLTGPAVLGVYAVASKFAELVKIPGMSLTYVLYPRFAKDGRARASQSVRRLVVRAGVLTAAIVAPLWLAAGFVVPAVYGPEFESAVLPAQIILLGLVLNGVGAVITPFLYGIGRPGLNSLALGAGLVATVVLDFLLIPPFHANGAAIASAVAYTLSTLVLVWLLVRETRTAPPIGASVGSSESDAA